MTASPDTSPRASETETAEVPTTAELDALVGAHHVGIQWRPGLDGLRAIAVASVFAYHSRASWATGGFLGVDVFFVLSGYLITALLVDDWARHGHIRLVRFWTRRARRLLPALGFLLVGMAVAVPLLASEQIGRLPGDLAAALGYVSNWRLIFESQSYFASVGRPPVLQHLWSLAVEEQFYLLWPLVLGFALRRRAPSRLVAPLLAGALASAALMAALHQPYADPSRAYYGTDTRLAAILIGAALACATWRWTRDPPADGAGGAAAAWSVAGGVGLLALLGCVATVDEFAPGLYRGGFLAVAVIAAVVVAAAARPGTSWFGTALGCSPLVWVGRRSYAIYLWYWPVIVLTRPHLDVPFDGAALWVLRIAITVGLADVSYRLVERPLRRLGRDGDGGGGTGPTAGVKPARKPVPFAAVSAIAIATVVALAGLALVAVSLDRPTAATMTIRGAIRSNLGPASVATGAFESGPATDTAGATSPPATDPPPVAPAPAPTVAPPPAAVVPAAPVEPSPAPVPVPAGVWAIGDSVMAGARAELEATGIGVDAVVGRQFDDTLTVARALAASGTTPDIVILQIGNNGPIGDQHIDRLMEALAGASRVIWITVKVDRNWEGHNNGVIAEGAKRWVDRATVADWRQVGAENPDAFYNDGLHLTPLGRQLYTELLLRALAGLPG